MKFIKLKIYDSNSLTEEVNLICQLHKQLIEEVERTGDSDSIKELEDLLEKIKERVSEITYFCERYSFDSRISVFIKLNKTLSRILGNYKVKLDPVTNTNTKNMRSHSQNNSVNDKSIINNNTGNLVKTKSNASINQNSLAEGSNRKLNSNRNLSQDKDKDRDNVYSYKKPETNFVNKINPKGGDKIDFTKEKVEVNPVNQQNSFNKEKEASDFNQWREIVFKIKLSPEEYNLLVNEKQNKRHFTNMNQTQQTIGNSSKIK